MNKLSPNSSSSVESRIVISAKLAVADLNSLKTAALQRIGVIIPTFNAESHWPELSASLDRQGLLPGQVLIVDSSSKDRTRAFARERGYRVVCIPQEEFRHGATRQLACSYFPRAERLVFMTQDAVLEDPRAIELLCSTLDDPAVGAAYGRQAPRADANAIERHARLFNYPATSVVKTFESRHVLGIKTPFSSNSFAAYRHSALISVGGFPQDVVLSEDTVVAARLLIAGWKVVYQADAVAVHSHPLRLRQEFSRYFDLGAHHSRESWIEREFGGPNAEGRLFLKSELRYLGENAPHLIPLALLRTVNKLVGYRLGRLQEHLPLSLTLKISSYPHFWADLSSQPMAVSSVPGKKEYTKASSVSTHVG